MKDKKEKDSHMELGCKLNDKREEMKNHSRAVSRMVKGLYPWHWNRTQLMKMPSVNGKMWHLEKKDKEKEDQTSRNGSPLA